MVLSANFKIWSSAKYQSFLNWLEATTFVYVKFSSIHALEYFGVCGPNKRGVGRFVGFLVAGMLSLVIPTFISVLHEDSSSRILMKIGYMLFLVGSTIDFFVIAWKNDEFVELLRKLETIHKTVCESEHADENLKILEMHSTRVAKLNRFYLCFGFVAYAVFILVPIAYTFISFIFWPKNPVVATATQLGPNDFYFDYTSNIYRAMLFHVIQFPGISFMDLIVVLDSFFFSVFALYGLPPLDVTIAMVKRLDGGKSLDKEAISKIVEMHNAALECISLLEDLMNLIFLCYHFVFLVVLSFVLFGISMYSKDFPADRVFTFLLCALGKVLAMCYTGTRLDDLAEKLSTAIYATKWYDAPVHIQKSILLMLQRSKERVGLSAGKFYYVDMESFADLVNESYSYYLIMKNMLE